MGKRFLAVAAGAALLTLPALAGNIVLTGHDDDFHYDGSGSTTVAGDPGTQLSEMLVFARAGSADPTLPVLSFDIPGGELVSSLTGILGAGGFTNIDPSVAGNVTDALFDPTKYSAIIVASDQSCGGCDLNATDEANISAHAAAIGTFFDGGGGIVGLAGAEQAGIGYYKFVPAAAGGFGSPPSTGYFQTADGLAAGIDAVNGDATHNFFFEPGTGGVSSAYKVFERLKDSTALGTAETIGCTGCTVAIITGGTPEPASIVLFGSVLLGLAGLTKFQRRARTS
jgi:hypothetical protein